MEPKIVNLGPIKVLSVRKLGPYTESSELAFEELLGFAVSKKLLNENAKMFGLSHDDPAKTPEDEIRYDACITFDGSVQLEGDVKEQTIGDGKYLMALHEGSYESEHDTYMKIFSWMEQNKIEYIPGPCIEKYLNLPEDTDPEDLKTEIYVPIK